MISAGGRQTQQKTRNGKMADKAEAGPQLAQPKLTNR